MCLFSVQCDCTDRKKILSPPPPHPPLCSWQINFTHSFPLPQHLTPPPPPQKKKKLQKTTTTTQNHTHKQKCQADRQDETPCAVVYLHFTYMRVYVCVCMCARVCVHACVCACTCACVRACVCGSPPPPPKKYHSRLFGHRTVCGCAEQERHGSQDERIFPKPHNCVLSCAGGCR